MATNEVRIPKQKRSIEKKDAIIRASYTLFCEKGYYKTNTAEIAKMAGVSTGIVYSYFQDKKDILDMIDLLETAMRTSNYTKWRSYLTPASITYWQNPRNLQEIESRLPVAGLKVNDLQDYFKYIFVPARAGRQVDEIRYISSTQVKAVQVQDHTDIVYYTFEKINGKWMLNLVPGK